MAMIKKIFINHVPSTVYTVWIRSFDESIYALT